MFNIKDEKIILLNKKKEYSWKEIKKLITPRIIYLQKNSCKNLLLNTENNFEFILNFFAGILSGKEIFLLPDRNKLHLLNEKFIEKIPDEENKSNTIDFAIKDPNNIYINFYTSGSTSTPKKIRKSLQNLIIEAKDLYEEFPFDKNLKFITTTRLTHMFGMEFALIFPFINGCIIDTDTIKLPEQIDTTECVFITTPSFVDKMVKYEIHTNPPKYIFTAGDKLKDSAFDFFENTSEVIDIYGCTEAGTIGYKTTSKTQFLTPLKNAKVTTDDKSQICVESPYFLEDKLFLNDKIELKNNSFRIIGRTDRILKIQEKRISAPELESYLNKLEIIDDSYCMKVGEKIGAVVILNSKGKTEIIQKGKLEIVKQLKSYLSKYSELIPQKWRFLNEIPKTITGKTDKEKILRIFNLNLAMPIITKIQYEENSVEISMNFLRHSNFFQGHFQDVPVLPGVVQLFFAHYFAEDFFNIELVQHKIKKVKFSKVIKPDTEITLMLKNNDLSVDYAYKDEENIYSSGTFIK